ncbi:MAG: hypothetical protein J07AB43_11670, partial [Candidatus Nanosalina sp. J07AB43]
KPVTVAVTEESVESIRIESASSKTFQVDVTVKGVRDGIEDKEVVREVDE